MAVALAACGDTKNAGESRPTVRTTQGVVVGAEEQKVAVFRGIPFAQAPVGPLRFAAPEPVQKWDGLRPAIRFGTSPPQLTRVPVRSVTSSEWLTINVWSPDLGGQALPVLVWIYGGAFVSGSSAQPVYDGVNLAKHGVVVVTFNYRLGVEGFAQITDAPANRGILDQLAALRWVHENIAAFGGDPGNVTLAGQSAGASSIAVLMTLPRARGLFRRAICQSVPARCQTVRFASDVAMEIVAPLAAAPSVDGLSGIDPQVLVKAAVRVSSNLPRYQDRWGYRFTVGGSLFGPVIDGELLTGDPWQAMGRGLGADIPLIVGHTRHEYRFALSRTPGAAVAISSAQTQQALCELPPRTDGSRAYRLAYPKLTDAQLYETACSDYLYRMPSVHLAQAHSGGGGVAYLYEFCFEQSSIGAGHTAEIPLVFGTLGGPGDTLYGPSPSSAAGALSAEMQRNWISFATQGVPDWAAYTDEAQGTQVFDTQSRVEAYPEQRSEAIWAPARSVPRVMDLTH
ncbi:carboxylesterase/lipase family protein [Mycobacteroides chelonae]|uniref:carboxylesterase/lipase family protein n=1 Tax=Mycobacteroides chelonae TaxID=1774 RepID=UPI0007B42646|nr:carboxylesterase family protein [Mycobacteroides chelonae]ANA97146.1 carboxylesterase [Mycobacteroides chelonae CCUG 47445]ORV16818.1 hypothetical protein AWB96_00580 [Mycobacteroides chelonae]